MGRLFRTGDRIEDDVTGVEDVEKDVTLTCYPNPFVSEISMALTQDFAGGGKVEIMNLMGQSLNNIELGESSDAILLKFDNLPLANILFEFRTGKTVGACRVVKN